MKQFVISDLLELTHPDPLPALSISRTPGNRSWPRWSFLLKAVVADGAGPGLTCQRALPRP